MKGWQIPIVGAIAVAMLAAVYQAGNADGKATEYHALKAGKARTDSMEVQMPDDPRVTMVCIGRQP